MNEGFILYIISIARVRGVDSPAFYNLLNKASSDELLDLAICYVLGGEMMSIAELHIPECAITQLRKDVNAEFFGGTLSPNSFWEDLDFPEYVAKGYEEINSKLRLDAELGRLYRIEEEYAKLRNIGR